MGKRTVKSAAAATNKWKAAMASPTTAANWSDGIKNVQQSPTAAAAQPAAEQAYVTGIQNSVSSGRRSAALNAVSLQQWQQQSLANGPSGLARAATKGGAKYASAANALQNVWQQASDAASAIPKVPGDMNNAAQRWQAAAQVMAQSKGMTKR